MLVRGVVDSKGKKRLRSPMSPVIAHLTVDKTCILHLAPEHYRRRHQAFSHTVYYLLWYDRYTWLPAVFE